ncbi:MAG: HNH endonuclease [Rubrivivax sp.]|nr:HNH endonuclease [Pyrinomonadaceae bacterium]
MAIFARDDYTCQHCGARSGKDRPVYLHAHHVKQFAYYPELRFEVSNGLTLCKECHGAVHRQPVDKPSASTETRPRRGSRTSRSEDEPSQSFRRRAQGSARPI